MDDETHRDCLAAVSKRIKHMGGLREKNAPQTARAGLVGMSYVINDLARRYLKRPEWQGHEVADDMLLLWEFEWYGSYCKAFAEVCGAVQAAVKSGRLILRSPLTRAPLSGSAIDTWARLDIAAAEARAWRGFFPGVLDRKDFDHWPDIVGLPPGAVAAEEFSAWAESEGLAASSEPQALPRSKRKREKWTAGEMADLKAFRDANGTKITADKYDISEARVRQLLPKEKEKKQGSVFTHRLK